MDTSSIFTFFRVITGGHAKITSLGSKTPEDNKNCGICKKNPCDQHVNFFNLSWRTKSVGRHTDFETFLQIWQQQTEVTQICE